MSEDASSSVHVVGVGLVQDAKAYEALTRLTELNSQCQIGLPGMGW